MGELLPNPMRRNPSRQVPGMTRKPGRPRRIIPLAALVEVDGGASLRQTAKKHGVAIGLLWEDCRRHGIKSAYSNGRGINETGNGGV
jgi:hypothetical protein